MFKNCWTEKYLNIAIVFASENRHFAYTYNPFWEEHNFLENFTSRLPSDLFYNKYFNINGRNLNILLLKFDDRSKIINTKLENGTLVFGGYEISFLTCLIRKMNGTMTWIPSGYHLLPGERNPWVQGNEITYTGADTKRRIITEQAIDIMNTEEMIQREEIRGVTESLYPHSNDNMRIIIRKGARVPYYIYLFFVFRLNVWYVFVGMLFVGTISWNITGSQYYPTSFSKFINILRTVTNGSLPQTSNKITERIFLIFWLFYALIITTAFTSNLTTVLMQDRYYPNYDTLEEIDKAGIVLVAFGTQVRELRKAFNGTSKFPLFQRMEYMPEKYDHVNNSLNNNTELLLEFTKKHPIFINSERAIMITKMKRYLNIFHIVKESPMPNLMAYQVPLG